jgi:hypothetical protein
MCIAGTFDGGIYLPFALAAEFFWNPQASAQETLKKVLKKSCVTTD